MKKTLLYFFSVTLFFTACKKDDAPIFDKSPDERINEKLVEYQSLLTSAENGWKAFLYPQGGGAYSFYFKFDNANRVNMLSSFDSISAVTLRESSYRLKGLQQPSLLFDTYSYLHVLSDPDGDVNGGQNGVGLRSDFEFYFDSTTSDTINLVGRFNGSRAVLVKASAEEAAGFINGQLATGFLLNKLQTYFKRLTIGSEKFDFNLNPMTRTVSLADATGNLLDLARTTRYYMTFAGIGFIKPLVVGNNILTGITGLNFNPSNQTISCTVNNASATISEVVVPLKVDVSAPRRWWDFKASTRDYWFSISGFHINGVDNAYRLDALVTDSSSYYYLIYWPTIFQSGEGILAPAFLNTAANELDIPYGFVPNAPDYRSDGRVIFTELGTWQGPPTTGPAANTAAKFYNSRGYYLVQTSQETYDMVSALDGKSWLTWQ